MFILNDNRVEVNKEKCESFIAEYKKKNTINIIWNIVKAIIFILVIWFFENEYTIYVLILLSVIDSFIGKKRIENLYFLKRAESYIYIINSGKPFDYGNFVKVIKKQNALLKDRRDKLGLVERDFEELINRGVFEVLETEKVENLVQSETPKAFVKKANNIEQMKKYDETEDMFSNNNIKFLRTPEYTKQNFSTQKTNLAIKTVVLWVLGILFSAISALLLFSFVYDGIEDSFGVILFCAFTFCAILPLITIGSVKKKRNFYIRAEKYVDYINNNEVKSLEDIAEGIPEELFRKESSTKYYVAKEDLEKLIKSKDFYIER